MVYYNISYHVIVYYMLYHHLEASFSAEASNFVASASLFIFSSIQPPLMTFGSSRMWRLRMWCLILIVSSPSIMVKHMITLGDVYHQLSNTTSSNTTSLNSEDLLLGLELRLDFHGARVALRLRDLLRYIYIYI